MASGLKSTTMPHRIELGSLRKCLNSIQEKVDVGIFFSLLFRGRVREDGKLENIIIPRQLLSIN
jgi:hypothetical protein